MDFSRLQYLVVGAGLSGLTVAERLRTWGKRVAVIDRRDHLGGLCAAETDAETGIEVHRHGTHVFHTDNPEVAAYIGRFCRLSGYRHRVWARCGRATYPLPINLATINAVYGMDLTPRQAASLLKALAAPHAPANLREAAMAKMGVKLYELIVEGYSRKHWGADPAELPAALAERIPVRTDYHADYFADRWQGLPEDGYMALFRRMARGVEVQTEVEFFEVANFVPADCTVVWTGPLDAWFGYRYGRLSWRGVRLEREIVPVSDYQGAAVINHCDEAVPYTRVHEFAHLRHGCRRSKKTVIAREFPDAGAEPAYPAEPDGPLAERYRDAATRALGVVFCGRLATYRYLDMDEAIGQALACAEDLCQRPF